MIGLMLEYVSPGGIGHGACAIAIPPCTGERFLALRGPEELDHETTVKKLWKANCYTREELREALAAAGFRVQKIPLFPLLAESVEPCG
jgi:hypothetical protein